MEKTKINQSDINYYFMVMINSVEVAEDGGWRDTAVVSQNYNMIKSDIVDNHITDPYAYEVDELLSLGFRKDKKDSNLYLVPVWFFDFMPRGTVIEHKESGEEIIKGEDFLSDTNFEAGLTSYGIRK